MGLDEDFPGIQIAGGNCRVTLRPTGEPLDYGIPTEIHVVAGAFSGSFRDRFVGSFQSFTDQVEALHKNLTGSAKLGSLEGHLKLTLLVESLGHISVRGEIIAEHVPRITLNFEFSIDQSYLPQIAKDSRRYFLSSDA